MEWKISNRVITLLRFGEVPGHLLFDGNGTYTAWFQNKYMYGLKLSQAKAWLLGKTNFYLEKREAL
jgi:hypothetical protein